MPNTPVKNFRIYIGFTRESDNDVSNLALDVSDALDGSTGRSAWSNPISVMAT